MVRQRQSIQEKAAAANCPAAEACPYSSQPTLLRNCHPPDTDGTPQESLCNTAGRVEFCGTQNFCCPSAGAAWTTNMTVCNSLAQSPTPAPTPVPTPTPTLIPTPTPTAVPNTCNGSCGSDSNCGSGLICSSGSCRNPLCVSSTSCTCGAATPTPVPTPLPTLTTSTPRPIPVTGVDWPTVGGIGVGAGAIILSILIAL